MKKIFIDGATGTTAFHIRSLLEPWLRVNAVELIAIDNGRDIAQRKAAYKEADLAIMCLPDDIARESAVFAESTGTRVLDTSSAHRVNEGWVFGFPELSSNQAALIQHAQKVTNPGCFATGAISILKPLIDARVIDKTQAHMIVGVGGYSAGGKKLIQKFQSNGKPFADQNAITAYGINAPHKHVKEIKKHAGLEATPIFMPHTLNVERGMMVSVAFNAASLNANMGEVIDLYRHAYTGSQLINVEKLPENQSRLSFDRFARINEKPETTQEILDIVVSGWKSDGEQQITIRAMLDNLGKGAATQALQNTRLMLDLK